MNERSVVVIIISSSSSIIIIEQKKTCLEWHMTSKLLQGHCTKIKVKKHVLKAETIKDHVKQFGFKAAWS